jgi:hypothetical protein
MLESAEGDEEVFEPPLELAGAGIPKDAPETEDEKRAQVQIVQLAKHLLTSLGAPLSERFNRFRGCS